MLSFIKDYIPRINIKKLKAFELCYVVYIVKIFNDGHVEEGDKKLDMSTMVGERLRTCVPHEVMKEMLTDCYGVELPPVLTKQEMNEFKTSLNGGTLCETVEHFLTKVSRICPVFAPDSRFVVKGKCIEFDRDDHGNVMMFKPKKDARILRLVASGKRMKTKFDFKSYLMTKLYARLCEDAIRKRCAVENVTLAESKYANFKPFQFAPKSELDDLKTEVKKLKSDVMMMKIMMMAFRETIHDDVKAAMADAREDSESSESE